MRRIFVAAAVATLAFVLSACGASTLTSDGERYYTSEARKSLVNADYNTLATNLLTALKDGKWGVSTTYTGNISVGAPSKCPPSGGEVSTAPNGRVQICSGDGKFAMTGTMTAGQMIPAGLETGIRLEGLEAWKDKDGVVSGYKPSGDAADIQSADTRLVAAFKKSNAKHFGS